MSKTELYYREIQNMAIESNCVEEYLGEFEKFENNQKYIKNAKIKSLSDKVLIYFIEYVNNRLETDFKMQDEKDIILCLHSVVNKTCLKLKSVCTDDIIIKILMNKKDTINKIIDKDYDIKRNRIKEIEKEIKNLKKGWL